MNKKSHICSTKGPCRIQRVHNCNCDSVQLNEITKRINIYNIYLFTVDIVHLPGLDRARLNLWVLWEFKGPNGILHEAYG